ncbi:MAG: hypothetical protein IJT27_04835 [Clostridia bacterium]|nr:hypothetical protein [Clostridia bacterium]
MDKNSTTAIKYVGAAMAVGGTAMLGTALVKSNTSLKKKAKKTAVKAMDAVDAALTSIQHYMK